jgi:hypothetical protein
LAFCLWRWRRAWPRPQLEPPFDCSLSLSSSPPPLSELLPLLLPLLPEELSPSPASSGAASAFFSGLFRLALCRVRAARRARSALRFFFPASTASSLVGCVVAADGGFVAALVGVCVGDCPRAVLSWQFAAVVIAFARS